MPGSPWCWATREGKGLKTIRRVDKELVRYRATGLTPEEITDHEEMFKAYREVCGGRSPEEVGELVRASQWISTADERPWKGVHVIGCWEDANGKRVGELISLGDGRWQRVGATAGWMDELTVSDWMPMPAPPIYEEWKGSIQPISSLCCDCAKLPAGVAGCMDCSEQTECGEWVADGSCWTALPPDSGREEN